MREKALICGGMRGALGRFAGAGGRMAAALRRVVRSFVAVLVVLWAAVFVAGCASKPQCRAADPADCPPRAAMEVPYSGPGKLARLVQNDERVDWTGMVDGEPYTLLHFVARGATDPALVDLLLDKGADVNARDRYYASTPLHLAAWFGEPDVAAALIARGADLEARDIDGKTPYLAAATRRWDADMLEVLAAAGADTGAVDFNGNTALHLAAADYQKSKVVIEYLIERGGDVNARNHDGDTPMHRASENNDGFYAPHPPARRFVKFERKALDALQTALYELSLVEPPDELIPFRQQRKIYRVLADNGAVIEIENNAGIVVKKTEYGFSLFGPFVEKYGEECDFSAGACFGVDWTAATVDDARNVNLHLRDDREYYRGWMPIHYAAANSSAEVVAAMIVRGANVHDGPRGFSPLHLAANRDTDEVASVLLAAGANPRARTNQVGFSCDRFTPLHLAHQKDVISLLMDAAPDVVYARAASGHFHEYTALHFLASKLHNVDKNPDMLINLLETAGVGALNLTDSGRNEDSKSLLDSIKEKEPYLLHRTSCLERLGFVQEKRRGAEDEHGRLMEWIVERGYDRVDPPAEFLLLDEDVEVNVQNNELISFYQGDESGDV